MSVYGARTIKGRGRRTKAEMEALRNALFEIVAENQPATVRGVFYLAETAGLVPKDDAKGYRPVQRELLKLRREGIIPWGWITDGSRSRFGYRRYGGLESYAQQVAANYRRDYWHDSEERVEVWIEKEALRGVISPVVIEEFGLDLYVTKGQPSVSYLYDAAEDIILDGRPTYVYVLADFDPGGLRIFDRIKQELTDFVGGAAEVHVRRLTLTPHQIRVYNLPTRPGKEKDPNAAEFKRLYGDGCVELDALPPNTMRALVRERLESHMDPETLRALKFAETEERQGLRGIQDLLGGVT
ncbi:MAG: hypothetical protein M3R38_18580 [Actinomycetota bacterium]|nr:hypothetical protein [Actinomycetota bacterium]